jgi:PAS domain S-box-containing protein
MLGVYQNVTERADAQRQAEARRQLLETLLASLPAGVWITDASGRINQANPAAQRIWGGTHYVGIEEYGRYKGWFVPSGKPIAVEEWAAARAIRRGETIVDEQIEIESFDGTHKIILSSATPLRDAAGDIAGAIVVNHDITALRQTEEALHDSEQRFRTLIEQAADGIFVHDLLGVIAEVNPQVCESLGYTRGELIGRPLTDIDQQLDPDRVRQNLLLLESGAPVVIDTVHRRKDGSTFPVEVRAVRITWNGQPHVLGTCRDVTERKEAERALHASEERFALAVHGSSDGIWDWDLETNRIYHSPRWLQMLGLAEDVPGGDDIATWVSWLHPDDRERVASTLFAHLEGRTSHYECEQRLLHTDGTYRWILARGACQRDANGKPYRMAGADTDLTERKRMEETIRLAEEQLRSAVEASRSGLWDHDLTTDVTRFSREWKAQLGYADDEIADRYEEWETRLHPDDRAQTLAIVRACRMPPWPDYEAEFRLRHKDGSYRWILARGRVLRDANGQPWHMMGAQVDLTERKQAEDALREARAALEIAVLAARAGLWDWDLQTGKTHYSDSWRTLFGYSPAEFDGSLEAWTTLVHPEDLERLAHSARGAVEAPTSPYEAEFRLRRSDGTYRWVLSRATVLRDAAGTPQRVLGAHVDITDRKQTELALQDAQASLKLATESAKVAVWKCNLRTLTIHFSSGWNRILGREEGEIRLTALWDLVHPDDRAKTTEAMQEHLQGRAAAYETEQRMLHADGSYRWVLSRGVVSPDTEGRPVLWFGADIDITDQKALEETLQRSEEGLRALAETLEQQVAERTRELSVTVERLRRSVDSLRVAEALSQLGSWEWDLSRDEIHWSNEQYRIFGFEPGARLTFSRVLDAVDREERSAVEQAIRDVLAGTRPLDVQCRIVQPRGEARWVHARAEVYRDGDGKPVRMVGAVLDITEHRRSEDRIRRSESRLQAIIAAEPECVKVIAPDGTLVDMNAAGLAMIEADSLEQVRGQQVGELAAEAYRDAFRELTARACAGGEGTLEFEIVGLKGTHRWLETHAVPLPHDPDEVGMALSVTRDITERKRAEDALLQLSADLEHRVLERTTQLEAANKELEAFSYSVSHDLRAPLRHIDGFSTMLLEDYSEKLDDTGRRYLDRIQAGCQRMGQLIDDLLALSRVSRQPLRRDRVDLSALARGVAAELRAANPDRTVDVVVADGIAAHGDASLLRVVLQNLLGNAWKYTAKHPRARIEFGMSAGERGSAGAGESSATRLPSNCPAVFFVRDNGAGFDPLFADKLFAPFQRLHSPAEFEGTGIGLAMVARIIRRHGGQVWAEGAVGQGATFYFSLGDSASASATRRGDGVSPPDLAPENRH